MTVQELIDKLDQIPDKQAEIYNSSLHPMYGPMICRSKGIIVEHRSIDNICILRELNQNNL